MSEDRFIFQGISISAINQVSAISSLMDYGFIAPNYICFPDTYTIFSAEKDAKLKGIINNAFLTMPDGKPLELFAKRRGFKDVTTVSGYWTCKALLADNRYSHYFYGSSNQVIENLKDKLNSEFPNANILGYKSPPFINIKDIQLNEQLIGDMAEIASLSPDFVWIGLNSPKQDYLIAHYYTSFSKSLLLGIGGVFEYLSDDIKKSPEWIKRIGLRWLYRFLKEPRRLWRKYWFVVMGFIKVFMRRI